MYKDSPLETIIKGAMAGLVGTLAITVAMNHRSELMQLLGLSSSQPAQKPQPPGGEPQVGQSPTEKLADKISAGILEQPLEPGTLRVAGQAIHWGYGAMWGVLYGILESSFHLPTIVHGAIFGSAVGLVSATALPAMGLSGSAKEKPITLNTTQMVNHLIFGWFTALAFRLLSRDA